MKLKKLEVNSFGGINPQSAVVIDFTTSKFVTIEGDMGVGKTSLLNALLVACGHLSKDNKDFINADTGKIDIDLSFVGKDNCNYEVKVTKSTFKLTYDGVAQAEPISKMKQLLGVVGSSPMEIKFKPLKDIIKWLSSYSNKTAEEFEAQLLKYKTGIKTATTARAAANKSLKALDEYLSTEELFTDWEGSEKKYEKPLDLKILSAKLDVAGKKSDTYLKSEIGLKNLKDSRPKLLQEIDKLKEELELKEKELVEHDKRINAGQKYIDENKSIKKEYDTVKQEYDNSHKYVESYNKWQDIKKKKSERDQFETLSQEADAKEKELLQSVKEFQSEILPDIKGMEIVTEDTTEDGITKKEGLYRNGMNVAQLSESEWVDTIIEIWRKFKVKVVVLDNIGTLGSKAVERLERLSKDGCTILAAEMNREIKELQINY